MINGEGTRPSTSEVTSRDPFDELSTWLDQKREPDDASNASSDYSSCEESEFERYCSANSVMGTASLSSSLGTCNDFLDSDFGSSRSLGFGRFGKIEFQNEDVDAANRARANWKITNWKKSLQSSEGNSVSVGFNIEGSGLFRDQRMGSLSPTGAEKRVRDDDENGEECSNSTRREFHSLLKSSGEENLDELTYEPLNPYDLRESGRGVGEEEETSSMREYSGDDDAESILSYGSDDERRIKLNYRQELKTKNENPILMNSSVAFGSDDWDDFIQESEQKSLASTLFDIPQETQRKHLETGETFVQSAAAAAISVPNIHGSEKEPIARDIAALTGQVNGIDNFQEDMEKLLIRDSLTYKDPLAQETAGKTRLTVDDAAEKELHRRRNEEASGFDKSNVAGSMLLGNLKLELDPLFESTVSQLSSCVIDEPRGKEAVVNLSPSTVEDNLNIHLKTMSAYYSPSVEQVQHSLPPIKVGNLDSTEDYDEVVLEMEEILLDSTESHGARFPQSNRASPSQLTQPFRDGSSTASISGTDDPYPLIQHPSKVDWVEVVGAKQKKGDVSLGERIVGVKEYTVYLLRVWSGKSQWEVERRYRDFFTLFRQLKTLFADHGWTLPAPWSRVDQESRKIFGNASPDIVSQRSALIQDCLRSILHSGFPHSAQNILIWFLSPQKVGSSSSKLNTSLSAYTAGTSEEFSSLGKTISLLVETQPRKPAKQLLEAQHYSCAGCHKCLDAEKTLVLEFVQTLGWGKPRLCEYTGQLFCASCHTNDTAVLPARVLHFWDFVEYPVSQFAKSYLESIYDQPMLCVSAVNPFLFSKVPALFRVMGFRKKIGAMMPYVRCPFRRSIQRGVGSRRYLLENNEFFALRDLVDLSKGAFSALPVMVETIFKKILEHITQRCLVCCDVGIPCGARQACEDPSSLIFPFQEDEVKRCNSCQTVFHKSCFQHLSHCPCGVSFKPSDSARSINQEVNCVTSNELDMTLDVSAGKPASGSSLGFLSSLFSKVKQEKVWGSKNSTPVILMGSLPNTFSDPL